MTFYYPSAFYLLLLIPGIFLLHVKVSKKKDSLIRQFGNIKILDRLILKGNKRIFLLKRSLIYFSLLFLTLSASRPQYGTKMMTVYRSGVDIMIAIDTSLSMNAQDISPSRFNKAKYELSLLIDKLVGNRIGIIAFSGEAFIECPLTVDYGAAKLFLNSLEPGIIQRPGTAIAKAIKKGVHALGKAEGKSKVLILLTDGENTEGDPAEESRLAADKGVRIYTIGVGGYDGAPIPVRDDSGNITGYKKDKGGNTVMTRLNTSVLEQAALLTDGKFYRAATGGDEIHTIYNDILKMEKSDFFSQKFTQFEDRFQYFILIAFILLFTETILYEGRIDRGKW